MAWDRTTTPIRVDECQEGYYLAKFGKGKVAIACRIVRHTEGWQVVIGGKPSCVYSDWAGLPAIDTIRFGKAITSADYDYWLARMEFARKHEPNHPVATGEKVDWRKMKP